MSDKSNSKTIIFNNKPSVCGYAAIGSKFEKDGPLGKSFDKIYENPLAGEKTWELAESKFQKQALGLAIKKSGKTAEEISYLFAGDLQNQCTASTFGIMEYKIPFIGMYGACSTMALTLINAAIYVNNGLANCTAAVTSSHFCAAERQYRFPLEYGGQRPPSAQWTATASGAVILSNENYKVKISKAKIGTVVDRNIKDANNMGAAMAPVSVKLRPYPVPKLRRYASVFHHTKRQSER